MRAYVYRVRDAEGRPKTGRRLAPSIQDVVAALQNEGYVVIDVKEQAVTGIQPNVRFKKQRSEAEALAQFCRQLAALIGSYVPLPQALQVLAGQTRDKRWRQRIDNLRSAVENGSPLSEAMQREGRAFPEMLTAMMAAGERAGLFQETLTICAEYFELESNIRRKIQSSLFYPMIVAVMCILVVIVMTSFVLPIFEQVLVSLHATVPLASRIVFAVGTTLQKGWPAGCLGMAAAVWWVRQILRTPDGRVRFYWTAMKVPVFGDLLRQAACARFCRVLGHLLGTHLNITEALEVAARAADNPILEEAVSQARLRIEAGADIATSLEATGFLTPMIVQMIRVGEESGTLPEMLHRAASYTEKDVVEMTQRLTTLLEPVLLLAVGGFVAFLIFSTLLPVFSTLRLIRSGM